MSKCVDCGKPLKEIEPRFYGPRDIDCFAKRLASDRLTVGEPLSKEPLTIPQPK